jgi:hypothetical protein
MTLAWASPAGARLGVLGHTAFLILMPATPRARAFAAALAVAAPAVAALATAAGAQQPAPTVERPAAFDSAGRVVLLTPALVARLQLAESVFPVRGPFVEARLFSAAEGTGAAGPAVLSVVRPGGAVERYPLGAAERAALTAAVAAGLAATGPGLRNDTAVVVSEPAGRAFVRNQTALGLFVYGPSAAVLAGSEGDGMTATLAYTAGAGAAFVASLATIQHRPVTRAQAILSGSMGLGGAAALAGALGAVTGSENERAYAGAVLAGGVGGSLLGLRRGAGMTDAEAAASASGASLAAATSAGLALAGGSYQEEPARRATIGVNVAALAAGYALGPRYARVSRYRVTAGDVKTITPTALTGALLGAALGSAFDPENPRRDYDRGPWIGATAGLVGGAVFADRVLVRRRDHTSSEADLLGLGAWVGGALGGALAGSADASGTGGLFATGLGALAGIGVSEALLKPAPDGGARRLRTSLLPGFARPLAEPGRLRVSPGGLALARLTAARGGRGTFPVLALTF